MVAGFVLSLVCLIAPGCASDPAAPAKKEPTGSGGSASSEGPVYKPIETKRLNLGETRVEHDVLGTEEPLHGRIEVRTWADEVIRGDLISETREALVIAVPGPGGEPRPRRVHRSAVMSLKRVGSQD